MKNRVSIVIYFLAVIAGMFNAYFAYKNGNGDATLAWLVSAGLVSAGLASGALGAHLEIREKNNEEK